MLTTRNRGLSSMILTIPFRFAGFTQHPGSKLISRPDGREMHLNKIQTILLGIAYTTSSRIKNICKCTGNNISWMDIFGNRQNIQN